MNILDAIKERRSVRTFSAVALPASTISALREIAGSADSPFGGMSTIRLQSFDLKGPLKPGTYGMINGASEYFLIASGSDKASALSVGYRFEEVILKAQMMGLGTCWIAGTFKDSDFGRGQKWPEGESLIAVCPVGVAAKPRLKEKVMRYAMGSRNRRPFDTLFFNGDFSNPLPPDSRYGEALEMMRLAPSARNAQPWRALVVGDTVHFYYKPTGNYALIDCGIGLRHFIDTELFYGRKGELRENTEAPSAPDDLIYLTSYIPQQ